MTTLRFSNGKCVEAHAPEYPSAILTKFFENVRKHYLGKTPEEITRHALGYAEVIKDWPAPGDMKYGWALTKNQVRMDMESYAEQAEAARKEQLQNSKLEMTG